MQLSISLSFFLSGFAQKNEDIFHCETFHGKSVYYSVKLISLSLVYWRNFWSFLFSKTAIIVASKRERQKRKILKLKIKSDILYANELKKYILTWALFGDRINYQHNFAVIFMQIFVAFSKAEETFKISAESIYSMYKVLQTLVWFDFLFGKQNKRINSTFACNIATDKRRNQEGILWNMLKKDNKEDPRSRFFSLVACVHWLHTRNEKRTNGQQ